MLSELGQSEFGELSQKFRDFYRLIDQLHDEEKKILAILSNSCSELKSETEQAEEKRRTVQEALKKIQFS